MCLSAVIFVIRRETALCILETQLFEAAMKIGGLGQEDRAGEVGVGKTGGLAWCSWGLSPSATFEAGSQGEGGPEGRAGLSLLSHCHHPAFRSQGKAKQWARRAGLGRLQRQAAGAGGASDQCQGQADLG